MTVTRPIANATTVYYVTDLSGQRIKIFFNLYSAELFAQECRDKLPNYFVTVDKVEHGTEIFAQFEY